MLNFKEYLTEGIRQGLPHITTMSHEQFHNLTSSGKVHLHDMTEKTDGQSFQFGHDDEGFYTQSTGSGNEKMRKHTDYAARAKARAKVTGKPLNLDASNAFGHVHKTLQNNKTLTDHLASAHKKKGSEVTVRGESFYRPWGKPSHIPGEVKFVGTSYDPSHIGKVGKIVIHTKLPENKEHDVNHLKSLGDEHINFDSDEIPHKKSALNISAERSEFDKLNHGLINSRTTPTNKESKLAEISKFDAIKKKVSAKVDAHIKGLNLSPKWGSESEGIVVHPTDKNPSAPRFKVTSDTFRQYRASGASNWKK